MAQQLLENPSLTLYDVDESRLFAIINPNNDLPYTLIEKKLISKHFDNVKEFIGDDVTTLNINKPAGFNNYFHFSGHGVYNDKGNRSGGGSKGRK